MKPIAADRLQSRRPGAFLAILLAAALIALSGCGEFNDSPADGSGGLTVNVGFAADGTAGPMGIGYMGPGEPVPTLVIGAIVISSATGNGPGGSFGPDDAATLTDAQRDALEKDVEQSLQYLEIVQLPTTENTISFPLPPKGAGRWQLVAVGLRHRVRTLGEIKSDSPTWYGFSPGFLNGVVEPGGVAPAMTMQPACTLTTKDLALCP